MCEQENHSLQRRRKTKRGRPARKGTIIVLSAVLLVVMMGLLALSIDTGYMYTMQSQLDRAVDSAALAGAGSLVEGIDAANDQVVEYLVRNPVGPRNGTMAEDEMATAISQFLKDHEDDYDIRMGHWNLQTGQLDLTNELPSAIEVTMKYPNLPLFFGRVLGKKSFDVAARAVAMYQPRDIMVVLDLSASMNDDSELKSFDTIGREEVLENLSQIHEELGSPTYGELEFEPQFATAIGVPPTDDKLPQITVEYRGNEVYITSSKDVSNVVLELSDGSFQRDESFSDGDTEVTMTASNTIRQVWVKSGTNAQLFENSNGYGEVFDFTKNETFIDALGLTSVQYPYSGSWSQYVDYVRTSSINAGAGYKFKFGHANLINFWLEKKPAYSETPDLWKVSAQPVTAVKDAVDVFMDYMRTVDTNDRLGVSFYNSSDGEGELGSQLTSDLDHVAQLASERQAGHYHRYTNIAAGLKVAREELNARGRLGAFKMVVLMTDGQANWRDGYYDASAARADVIQEAYSAADKKYPVVTISLGAGADMALMDEVAEITNSRHFNIPGGQTVEEYRTELFEAFREIADARPLKIVN